jgi:hypothetical protein
MSNVNESGHAKIFRLQNLVRRRVVENSFGMDASFVGESRITSHIVVERDLQ